MKDTLNLANNKFMWILAIVLIIIVILQTFIFYIITRKYVKKIHIISDKYIKKSLKIGFISSIGPAMAVFAIAVALIAQIGGPITLARVGVIGSASFEMISAKIGSGGTIGSELFTPKMLSTAAWVMVFGGSGWLLMALFATKHIDSINSKIKERNPLSISYMSTFAPFVLFFTLFYNEVSSNIYKGSFKQLAAGITGALVIIIINTIVKKYKHLKWLKEWSMGFAVIFAMIIGSLF